MDKLLILDDEALNLKLFQGILEQQGYEVYLVSNYEDFIQTLDTETIDLILLDYMMPGRNGLQILHELKENRSYKSIPVIMVTALDDPEIYVKSLEMGAEDYITKPVNQRILNARVSTIINNQKYQLLKEEYQLNLELEINKKTKKLIDMVNTQKLISNEIINRLAMAAEYRDTDTGGHIQRMAEYSEMIALAAGFNPEQCHDIKQAAKMHDLGKISIPDKVLLKPGKLDSEEWDLMKKHTTAGAEMLQNSKINNIQIAEKVALSHHEKWDGSGYPQGIKGEIIPVEARIVAIADVFDALTSRRPYKEPFSIEKSLEIITQDSGTHFDPELTDHFLNNIEDIKGIHAKWSQNT